MPLNILSHKSFLETVRGLSDSENALLARSVLFSLLERLLEHHRNLSDELLNILTKNLISSEHMNLYMVPLYDDYKLILKYSLEQVELLFVGKFEDYNEWLTRFYSSQNSISIKGEVLDLPNNVGAMISRLPKYIQSLLLGLDWHEPLPEIIKSLYRVKTLDDYEHIAPIFTNESQKRQEFLEGLFCYLSDGILPIDYCSNFLQISLENEIITLNDICDKDLAEFEKMVSTERFYDWMLYLHPDQKRIIEENFNKATILQGVSGSGKTTILVHRAHFLAKKYPNENIGVFTINHSLAELITILMDRFVKDEDIKSRIHIRSIHSLSKQIINFFEPNRTIQLIDTRSGEVLEDNWTDSFSKPRQKINLRPVIQRLQNSDIDVERYIRDEFIWLRSALPKQKRLEYTNDISRTPRVGRKIAFTENLRRAIVSGLEFYEEHLVTGGFLDDAGMSLQAHEFIDRVSEEGKQFQYRSILIDEYQDLGTIEVSIILGLLKERALPNSLFFAGDQQQQVFPKDLTYSRAGIESSNFSRRYLRKNYRNPLQIINLGVQILYKYDPEFDKNTVLFSSRECSKPLCIESDNEIKTVIDQIKNHRSTSRQPCCIVYCGVRDDDENSLKDVQKKFTQKKISILLLREESSIMENTVYLSTLETIKGFEFSKVIVYGCSEKLLPNPHLPREEHWRDARRLYVAITRARDELILVYKSQDKLSYFLKDLNKFLLYKKERSNPVLKIFKRSKKMHEESSPSSTIKETEARSKDGFYGAEELLSTPRVPMEGFDTSESISGKEKILKKVEDKFYRSDLCIDCKRIPPIPGEFKCYSCI